MPVLDPHDPGTITVPQTGAGTGTPDATAMQLATIARPADGGLGVLGRVDDRRPRLRRPRPAPLPDDLADISPQAGDSTYPFGALMLDLDDADGYDDVRHDVLDLTGPINAYPPRGSATSGRRASSLVRLSEWLLPQ